VIDYAIRYAKLGWPIFPVYEPISKGVCSCLHGSQCKRPGKHPRNRYGNLAASNKLDQIRHWWGLWPKANIALDTSAGLVIDVDGVIGERSLHALERQHGQLPHTVEAFSRSHHKHIFFSVPHELKTTSHHFGEKLDTRALGGYVILPPSRHASGHMYRWKRSPYTCELAEAPQWVVTALTLKESKESQVMDLGGTPPEGAAHDDRSRSGRDMALALRMLRDGAGDEDIELELYRTSRKIAEEKGSNAATYVRLTCVHARRIHDENAPRAVVRAAWLDRWPEQLGRLEMSRVRLDLEVGVGRRITTGIVIPGPGYRLAASTWTAAFPDVDAEAFVGVTSFAARRAFTSIAWVGRTFHVAVRGGDVVWIRAIPGELP
jgi:hypothetical protein